MRPILRYPVMLLALFILNGCHSTPVTTTQPAPKATISAAMRNRALYSPYPAEHGTKLKRVPGTKNLYYTTRGEIIAAPPPH